MRSLLFVPAHDARKTASALQSGADALILDLEDAVPDALKVQARQPCAAFVAQHRARMRVFVRVNALSTGLAFDDLAAVIPARPYGIMLPKCANGAQVAEVGRHLDALEATAGGTPGETRILPIVSETAASIFGMSSYASDAGPRLCGMLWGAEDLATDIGATGNRLDGAYRSPFLLARNLCLFAASAAGVPAIDAVFTDFRDNAGLLAEARAAAADGFGAKAAIHPAQLAAIHEAFTPSDAALAWARRVIAAFDAAPSGAGATSIDGNMLDRPHYRAAQCLLERAGARLA